jgi:hypothetical protein
LFTATKKVGFDQLFLRRRFGGQILDHLHNLFREYEIGAVEVRLGFPAKLP